MRCRAVRPHVDLEPQVAAGFSGDAFERGHRTRGQGVRYARGFCGARQRDFAFVPCQSCRTGRPDHQRHGLRLAVEGGREAAPRSVDQHVRVQLDQFECGAVVGHRHLIAVAAVEKLEHAPGQAPAREFAQVGDVIGAERRIGHVAASSRWNGYFSDQAYRSGVPEWISIKPPAAPRMNPNWPASVLPKRPIDYYCALLPRISNTRTTT